ncbi:MAG: FAD-binding protein [Candidatus Bathyarchaeia archaeon]
MEIILCIKQVPDTADMRIDPKTNNLMREGVPSVVNPTDLHATEEALRLKDKLGAHITAITMGPPQADQGLRELIAMGVDQGVLLSDRPFAGADTLATSYAVWKAITKLLPDKLPDIVMFGKTAIDGETGQTPPGVAVRLGIPIITYAVKIEKLDLEKKFIEARRRVDEGVELIRSSLPVALTMTEEASKPRQASIDGVLRAKRSNLLVWNKDAIGADPNKVGLPGSPTFVRKVFVPPPRKKGEVFNASSDPIAAGKWLVDQLLAGGALGQKSRKENDEKKLDEGRTQVKLPPGKYGDIWVYMEHRNGVPSSVSWELMGEASKIAKIYGKELCAIAIGSDVSSLTKGAFAYGAEKVYVVSHPVLTHYRTKPYSEALASLIKKYRPEGLIIGGTLNGRDLAGAVVTLVETGAIADCTGLEVEEKFGLQGTRPDFGGKEMSNIVCPKHRPVALTVRPRVFRAPEPDFSREGKVIREKMEFSEDSIPTKMLEFLESQRAGVRLEDAEVIVAAGRGLGSPKNLYLVEDMAKAVGGVVGATRAIVYSGWIGREYQIGQTGFTVRPRLYFAVGISGAIQHLVGMQNSDKIVAINKDQEAPIFGVSDYGIVGDLFKVVPAFVQELKSRGLAKG